MMIHNAEYPYRPFFFKAFIHLFSGSHAPGKRACETPSVGTLNDRSSGRIRTQERPGYVPTLERRNESSAEMSRLKLVAELLLDVGVAS